MEPYLLVVLIVFGIFCARRRQIQVASLVALAVVLVDLPWWVYWERVIAVGYEGVLPIFRSLFLAFSLGRMAHLLQALLSRLVSWEGYGLAGLLFLIAIAVKPCRLRNQPFVPAVVTLAAGAAVAIMYIILGDASPSISVRVGAAALMMPLIPLVVYWSVPAITERVGAIIHRQSAITLD
jgi:hypothetical protein